MWWIPSPIGLPSLPHTLTSTVQQYGQNNVTLTVQWQPPQYDGGAPVNYTITVSPGLSPVTTSGTSVPVTVSYNVIHTVSIVATNCNGSSSATMETIPAIGKLSCYPILPRVLEKEEIRWLYKAYSISVMSALPFSHTKNVFHPSWPSITFF